MSDTSDTLYRAEGSRKKMMSDNRIEIYPNLVRNTQNAIEDNCNLHSKKLQTGLNPSYNVSDVSKMSENKKEITYFSDTESIESSLDFLLWHFEGQHSLFPRNIATGATNGGQKIVYDRDRAILFIQGALRQDCYLSVYPNYEELAKNDSITPDYLRKPDHIFIDLDLKQFGNDINKLNQGLKVTLKNIHQLLNGAVPTVLLSGGGIHIHQPLDANALPVFENVPEFKRFGKDITTEFMRYAERRLTNYKSDPCHKIAWMSCLARIPNTINTKYPAKVRIVQRWDGVRARPTKQFMLTDFLVYLIEKNFDFSAKARQKRPIQHFDSANNSYGYVGWIEKLLDTPIDDYRKSSRDLIIVPYLVVRRGMTDIDQIEAIVLKWADKCGQLYPLEPSRRKYAKKIRSRAKKVMRDMIPPMRFDTLQEENPALAKRLMEVGK